jgi:outer membrane protein assembly factor BamE (lipoprotein component of BamABCDE complex)
LVPKNKQSSVFATKRVTATRMAAALSVSALVLAGCNSLLPRAPQLGSVSSTTHHGYILAPDALEQVPVGSSRDQVLIALGTPSTSGQFSGEVFYYISQTRRAPARFMNAKVIEQRVVAIYFDKNAKVARLANYGLQDGKIFDFVTRTTPTGGADLGFLQSVLSAAPGMLGGGGT